MNYQSLNDISLIAKLRQGDVDAYKEIYIRYWKKMLHHAQHKLANLEASEEIIQNIFLTLWEKRHRLEIESLEAYLFSALKYQVIDYLRKQIQEKKYLSLAQGRFFEFSAPTDSQLTYDEILSIFEKTLLELPDKTARIFRMSRLEHKSTKEIAASFRLTERAVEYHISQALRLLRIRLTDYLPFLLLLFSSDLN